MHECSQNVSFQNVRIQQLFEIPWNQGAFDRAFVAVAAKSHLWYYLEYDKAKEGFKPLPDKHVVPGKTEYFVLNYLIIVLNFRIHHTRLKLWVLFPARWATNPNQPWGKISSEMGSKIKFCDW